jgi:putrescine transport system substrate-binding protein
MIASAMRCCAIVAACFLSVLPAVGQETTLNVYGWADYRDQAVLDQFTKETGIKVRYDVFVNQAMLEATMGLAQPDYDVVMATNEPSLSQLVRKGLLLIVDRARVPNWRNLDPALMQRIEISDPGNKHAAIFLWGMFGLGLLPEKVKVLAPDAPLDSWDLLFNVNNAKRLQPCGLNMLDSPNFVIPAVLRYLGLPPASSSAKDLAAVEQTLMSIRPYITSLTSTSALATLAAGTTCVALANSGNVMQAAVRSDAADHGPNIQFVLPKEGAIVSFDTLAIPSSAPHKDEAYAFINFMLQPDIIAHVTNATRYANAVPTSYPMVDPALLKDTDVFPTQQQMDAFFTLSPLPLETKMARNRLWARFKQGR